IAIFLQVDAIAVRQALHGIPKSELPRARTAMKTGWIFLLPFVVLVYLLFWRGYDPALSALFSVGALLVLAVLRQRKLLTLKTLTDLVVGAGENMLPLLMIGGGAGVV